MSNFRRRLGPYLNPLFHMAWRFSRPMTLGVRGLALDGQGRVLLVRHTYKEGWYFPGGGVEAGQTAEQALKAEMQQEAGVDIIGAPELIGIYSNEPLHRGDHVIFYRVREWREIASSAEGEIEEIGFFPRDQLPDLATPATRRRLAEVFEGTPKSPYWPVTSA